MMRSGRLTRGAEADEDEPPRGGVSPKKENNEEIYICFLLYIDRIRLVRAFI
jgi:hypothetical protein